MSESIIQCLLPLYFSTHHKLNTFEQPNVSSHPKCCDTCFWNRNITSLELFLYIFYTHKRLKQAIEKEESIPEKKEKETEMKRTINNTAMRTGKRTVSG